MSVQTSHPFTNSFARQVNSTSGTLLTFYAMRYCPEHIISLQDLSRWLEGDGWNLQLLECILRHRLRAALSTCLSTDPDYITPDMLSIAFGTKLEELNTVMDAFCLKDGIFIESTVGRDYDLLVETICAILLTHQSN